MIHNQLNSAEPPYADLQSRSRCKHRQHPPGSEPFSILNFLEVTTFVLLGVFTLIETICPKMCSKSRFKSAKSPLQVDVRSSKTSLLKLRINNNNVFPERVKFNLNLRKFGPFNLRPRPRYASLFECGDFFSPFSKKSASKSNSESYHVIRLCTLTL